MTASALGPRGYEILCVPFKSGVSVSPNPLWLLKLIPEGLQSQAFQALVFPGQDPWAGESSLGLRLLEEQV